jgi:hypothetical protein
VAVRVFAGGSHSICRLIRESYMEESWTFRIAWGWRLQARSSIGGTPNLSRYGSSN